MIGLYVRPDERIRAAFDVPTQAPMRWLDVRAAEEAARTIYGMPPAPRVETRPVTNARKRTPRYIAKGGLRK